MRKLGSRRRRVLALPVLAVIAIAAVGTAVAAFPQDNVKLYTGCLTAGGSLVYVAEGDNPLQPCNSPKQMVKLSGGDITSLTVTAPLTGGGTNGAVTIGLDATATLPSCSTSNAVPKWNLSTSRWTCGTDNDTTYTHGTGLDLDLGTNAFSIKPEYRVKNTPDCSSGQFATGFDSTGDIQCAAPATGGVQAFFARSNTVDLAGETTVISKTLPAGTYLLFASVELVNRDQGFSIGGCSIPGFATENHIVTYEPSFVRGADSLSLASAITHPGGAVELKCTEYEADIDVFDAALTAIKVSSLG